MLCLILCPHDQLYMVVYSGQWAPPLSGQWAAQPAHPHPITAPIVWLFADFRSTQDCAGPPWRCSQRSATSSAPCLRPHSLMRLWAKDFTLGKNQEGVVQKHLGVQTGNNSSNQRPPPRHHSPPPHTRQPPPAPATVSNHSSPLVITKAVSSAIKYQPFKCLMLDCMWLGGGCHVMPLLSLPYQSMGVFKYYAEFFAQNHPPPSKVLI